MNDILCCLKIIPKSLIDDFSLTSRGFSIETEIMSKLVLNKVIVKEVIINYHRRTKQQGKKIKYSDGLSILLTMLKFRFFYNHKRILS